MKIIMIWCGLMMATTMIAQPLRVAVLDFENEASVSPDAKLVGGIKPKLIADKGVYALSSALANQDKFVLIDRRDFMRQIQRVPVKAGKKDVSIKPSFLRAAQAVNADVVLRGILLSYAPGKKIINQGGYKTEFVSLSLRVALQALDTRDGAVIAMAEGVAHQKFRQTDAVSTVVGEDDLMTLLNSAIKDAIPALNQSLQKRISQERARPMIKLSVKTSADPALVEIDGMLIGTTPLTDFEIYKGDHVITVGKAGYQDVNKRILLNADTSIEVPILRTKLSADELKEVLETMRMNVIVGIPEPALIINTIESE